MRLRRGYTLAEFLIAMVVLASLTAVVSSLLVGISRLGGWISGRSELQSQAMLALQRMALELRMAQYRGITVVSPGPKVALSFLVQDPDTMLNSLSAPYFQAATSYVVYYYDGTQSWVRKTYGTGDAPTLSPTPGFGFSRLTPDELTQVVDVTTGTEQTVAAGVKAAVIAPPAFPLTTAIQGFTVRLTLQRNAPVVGTVNRPLVAQVQTMVVPKN